MEEKRQLGKEKPKVINIGLRDFYEAMRQQGVEAVHVDWKPPGVSDAASKKQLRKLL